MTFLNIVCDSFLGVSPFVDGTGPGLNGMDALRNEGASLNACTGFAEWKNNCISLAVGGSSQSASSKIQSSVGQAFVLIFPVAHSCGRE